MNFWQNWQTWSGGTESPAIFMKWAGLSTLSALLSRRFWIDYGIFRIYPNTFILLVGPPGCGKDIAISKTKKIVEECEVRYFAGKTTKEAFAQKLSTPRSEGRPNQGEPLTSQHHGQALNSFIVEGREEWVTEGIILEEEFVNYISNDPIGWVTLLTKFWSSFEDVSIDTKHAGNDNIINPYICILGGMTPNGVRGNLLDATVGGGFARRTLFIVAEGREGCIPFPFLTPEQQQAKHELVKWATRIRYEDKSGQLAWSPDAKDWFTDWYASLRAKAHDYAQTPATEGYFNSKHVQLLKMSILFCVGESFDLVLKPEHMMMSLQMLNEMEKSFERVFLGMGRSDLGQVGEDVVKFIVSCGGRVEVKAVRKQFLKDTGSLTALNQVISDLKATEKVTRTMLDGVDYLENTELTNPNQTKQ